MGWWQDQKRAWRADWSPSGKGLIATLNGGRWLVGFLTRLTVYGLAGLALYYFLAPTTNIFDKPIASLTLGEIFHTIIFCAACFVLVAALFSPSDDPDTQKSWATVGLALLAIGVVVWLYFNNDH